MKKVIYICLLLTAVIYGCEVDNYDPPASQLSGRIVFNGDPVYVRQGISVLQLYQPGFELKYPINVNVKDDGTFSSLLFDGNYQLVRIAGNGPWESNTDTIAVEVRGSARVEVPVTPYFTISNAAFSVENDSVKASCTVTNQVSGRQVERVVLIVGKTTILDDLTKIVPSTVDLLSSKPGAGLNLSQPVALSQHLSVSPLSAQAHLFARIGVKTVGVTELIYSPVFRIR